MNTDTINTWYVLATPDFNEQFGFRQIESKNYFYVNLNDAVDRKEYYLKRKKYKKVVILKRTCQVIG